MNKYLLNWIPEKFVQVEDQQLIQWLYVGQQPYTDPFFDETINKCRPFPENMRRKKVLTSVDWLIKVSDEIDAVDPSAFIFHVSRCGSTMISQLLGLFPNNIVLAEVPFFDDILQNKETQGITKELLHAALKIYGQKRNGNETHLFIKTDSWHLHSIQKLRSYFPGVPFYMLCRNPVSVLQSQYKRKGLQAVPGLLDPAIFGLKKEGIQSMHPDKYMEVILAGYYCEILEHYSLPHTHLLYYEEGLMKAVELICDMTGVSIYLEDYAFLQNRMSFHSKDTEQPFVCDIVCSKIEPGTEVMKLYDQIWQKRDSHIQTL